VLIKYPVYCSPGCMMVVGEYLLIYLHIACLVAGIFCNFGDVANQYFMLLMIGIFSHGTDHIDHL
jgi:hypothetical protein